MEKEELSEAERVSRREFLMQVSNRTGIPIKVVTNVYDTMLDELMDIMVRGDQLTLTGFGKFYSQPHKGHRVQFAGGGSEVIDDYRVLKFSATRAINKSLAQAPKPRPERLTAPEALGDSELAEFEPEAKATKKSSRRKTTGANSASAATTSTRAKNRAEQQVLDMLNESTQGEKMI